MIREGGGGGGRGRKEYMKEKINQRERTLR